jgi:hypothetical protein
VETMLVVWFVSARSLRSALRLYAVTDQEIAIVETEQCYKR